MKVKFKVQKTYNGKNYYPNIEYVIPVEAAKEILSKTKYVEVVEEKSPLLSGNEEQKVDASEHQVDTKGQKRTTKSKKVVKKEENAQ